MQKGNHSHPIGSDPIDQSKPEHEDLSNGGSTDLGNHSSALGELREGISALERGTRDRGRPLGRLVRELREGLNERI